MKKIRILYIGNNLAKKTKYLTTLENLSQQLIKDNLYIEIKHSKGCFFFAFIYLQNKLINTLYK